MKIDFNKPLALCVDGAHIPVRIISMDGPRDFPIVTVPLESKFVKVNSHAFCVSKETLNTPGGLPLCNIDPDVEERVFWIGLNNQGTPFLSFDKPDGKNKPVQQLRIVKEKGVTRAEVIA